MTDSTRSEITNGIWLCRNCHRKVDQDANQFPAEMLFDWRQKHETYVRSELGKRNENALLELHEAELQPFEQFPRIVKRIILDRPPGWEYRLAAELLRHLNEPIFRRLSDLRNKLYTMAITHISSAELSDWGIRRVQEMSILVKPIETVLNNLTASFGKPGEAGDPNEILHACILVRDCLSQALRFEEGIYFTVVPTKAEKLRDLFKDCMGSQVEKIREIPKWMDSALDLIGTDHNGTKENPAVLSKTITLELPKGWASSIERELRLARHGYKRLDATVDSISTFLAKTVLVTFLGFFAIAIIAIILGILFR